jgi:hypothetical protein
MKSRRMRWAGHVVRVGDRRDAYMGLMRRLEGSRPLERPRCRWEDNIKVDLQEVIRGVMRVGTAGGGRLWMRYWTFGLHKMREISWLAEKLLTSQEGLCYMELVTFLILLVRDVRLLVVKSKHCTCFFFWGLFRGVLRIHSHRGDSS